MLLWEAVVLIFFSSEREQCTCSIYLFLTDYLGMGVLARLVAPAGLELAVILLVPSPSEC